MRADGNERQRKPSQNYMLSCGVPGRSCRILRRAESRWRSRHSRYGGRDKVTKVMGVRVPVYGTLGAVSVAFRRKMAPKLLYFVLREELLNFSEMAP